VGIGPEKLPVRLAAAAAVLVLMKTASAKDPLDSAVSDAASSKMIHEASVDLGRAVLYCVERDNEALPNLASLAHGKYAWSNFMEKRRSVFTKVMSQLVVPGSSADKAARLVPPYDMVVQTVLAENGTPLKLSEEQFRTLVPSQLAFFADIKRNPRYKVVFNDDMRKAMSRKVLDILQRHNAAYFPGSEAAVGSRAPRNCAEFYAMPVVKNLALAASVSKDLNPAVDSNKPKPKSWVEKLQGFAAEPSPSKDAEKYFATAGYELMCAMRHWFVHDRKAGFSIYDSFWLGLGPKAVCDLVQIGLCQTAFDMTKDSEKVFANDLVKDKDTGYYNAVNTYPERPPP
jgi:hypothetical protein